MANDEFGALRDSLSALDDRLRAIEESRLVDEMRRKSLLTLIDDMAAIQRRLSVAEMALEELIGVILDSSAMDVLTLKLVLLTSLADRAKALETEIEYLYGKNLGDRIESTRHRLDAVRKLQKSIALRDELLHVAAQNLAVATQNSRHKK